MSLSLDKIAVVAYSTDNFHRNIKLLKDSMSNWGWPELNLSVGDGVFRGHMGKLLTVKWSLPGLREKGFTHALYTDCWDVMCCGPFEDVLKSLKDWQYGAMLSADAGNWSTIGLEDHKFPESGTRYRFVNGGGWIGSIEYLMDTMLFNCESEPHIDQWFLARQYIHPTPGLKLDSTCKIFQCLSRVDPINFQVEENRVINQETNSRPLLIHGAGGTDMSWVPSPNQWHPVKRNFDGTGT